MAQGERPTPSADDTLDVALDSTESRILEGALRTLGRHGSERLRMNAVSAAAQVSRGTLYRYFPTKGDLLAALVEYERRRFIDALDVAIESGHGPAQIDLVLDFIVDYLREHPALDRLLRDEPEFVLRYLRHHFSFLLQATAWVLTDDSGEIGPPTQVELAEVALRVLVANFLVPPKDPAAVNRTLKRMLEPQLSTPAGQ